MGLNIFQKKLNSSKGIKAFKTNIYGIKTKDSIKCGFFCIGFIDFMINGKSLLECTSFFSPDDYEKNYKIILKYFL